MEGLKTKTKRIRTPDVFQAEACECGAAALSMILRYYGCELPLEQIRSECGISRDGCSAADVILAGQKYGLDGHGYRVNLEQLAEVPLPCILHWNMNHFVVLEQVSGNYVWINDPARGHRRVTKKELDQSYTGILLSFRPADNFRKQHQPSGFSALLRDRLLIDRGGTAYVVLSGLFLMLPGVVIPLLSRSFIDDIIQDKESYALVLVVALGALYFFQILSTAFRSFILCRLKLKISVVSTDGLLYRMLRLPMLFYEQRYTGDLSRRMEINEDVNEFLTGPLLEAVLNACSALCCLVMMPFYSLRLTITGLLGLVCNFILVRLFTNTMKERNGQKKQQQCRMTGALCAGVSASSTIKACGAEDEYTADILGKYAALAESEQKLGMIQQIIGSVPSTVSSLFSVLVLAQGCLLVMKGHLTIGMLIAFCQLLSNFCAPVNSIFSCAIAIHEMKAGYSKVEDIASASPDRRFIHPDSAESAERDFKMPGLRPSASFEPHASSAESGKSVTAGSGTVTVENITFGYSPNVPPVIRNFSAVFPAGSCIGIVGVSGSGKSTLGRLLSGLLIPASGCIRMDGVPLEKLPDETLCGYLSAVTQEPELLAGTITENMVMFKKEYDRQNLAAALEDSEAEPFVNRFPEGPDTVLAEGGKNLSGGERQRIQIARALAENPSVLILDEATSALDPVTEQRVMEKIRSRGCTCIVIAHRLSTVRKCDAILVLERGKIAEAGTHEDLLSRKGLYYRLVSGC